ncbi:hypothetical protein [Rhizobium sp. BK176]|uniref:hypothetical protein n=1 Tax=Rhizobium sp. BK176 TaxID=2587071 RepID=UPI00216A0FAD|nr:hypothetical protein [Rhizobium sp. BK176]MCS4088858.1 hypothetical protein [Rhizobium sp. BK176]
MLFNVPLAYTVKGTPKGKRTETTEQYWEYVEVDIPVLTDEAAPLAVEWDDSIPADCTWHRYRDDWENAQRVPENGIHAMRMKEGEFYLRRTDGLTPDTLASKLNPHADFRIFGENFIHYDNKNAEKPVDQSAYRQDKDFSSTFDEEVSKLRRAAERVFIVGDEIYEPSSEPVVTKVSYQIDGNAVKTIPRIMPNHKLKPTTITYRIDKYAQVVAEINEHNAMYSLRKKDVITMDRAPTVYLESAASFNDLEVNFVNAVRAHIDRFSDHTKVKTVDPDFGIAFLQLRKALAEFEKVGVINALEAAAANLIESFPEEIRHDNLVYAYREFADRPVDTLSSGSWRNNQ